MNEQDIPIDIHTSKLQDWLVSRRIVEKNWPNKIREIRDKIKNAIVDMPEEQNLLQLLSGAHINYFHCLQIIEILKETEADTKNVFGMYGSRRMRDWQDIVKLYENGNVYLGEAAQIIVRNVQYEVPSLRKQIAKSEQMSVEAERKIIDLGKSENVIKSEYSQMLTSLGIKGESIRTELVKKLEELPAIYEKIATFFPALNKSVNLYSEFCGRGDCLGMIRHITTNGNTTVYQYLYTEVPLSIEEPRIKINVEDSSDQAGIDFGDLDDGDSNRINFEEINYEDITLETGDIDWGTATDNVDQGAGEIELNLSLEESGIEVEEVGHSGGVAKDEEAYTLLDLPKYKDQVVDELMELEAFLKMRLYELTTTKSTSSIITLLDGFSERDSETIEEMLQNVEIVLSRISDPLVQHLNQIKHSPKYVDILAGKLQQKLQAVDKMKTTSKSLKVKSKEYLEEAASIRPTIARIIEKTKILQEQIEKDISKRYKNRVVNLMGGINTI